MSELYDHARLIEQFLNKEITVQEFERTYFHVYASDEAFITEDLDESLDDLFANVEMFTDLPISPDNRPEFYINEDELRITAARTLAKVRELQKQNRIFLSKKEICREKLRRFYYHIKFGYQRLRYSRLPRFLNWVKGYYPITRCGIWRISASSFSADFSGAEIFR